MILSVSGCTNDTMRGRKEEERQGRGEEAGKRKGGREEEGRQGRGGNEEKGERKTKGAEEEKRWHLNDVLRFNACTPHAPCAIRSMCTHSASIVCGRIRPLCAKARADVGRQEGREAGRQRDRDAGM